MAKNKDKTKTGGGAAEPETKLEEQSREKISVTEAKSRYTHLTIDTSCFAEESAQAEKDSTYFEVGNYSITPRTFNSRTYEDYETTHGLIYRDEFAFGSNRVTRYGINSRNIEIDIDAKTLVGESASFYIPTPETSSRGSTTSSRQSSQKPEFIKALAESTVHHALETHLVEEAMRHLFAEELRKTVLVDIFARKEGAVTLQQQEVAELLADGSESRSTITVPETHTVVFYKNPSIEGKHTILIIDPSSFAFSSHLSNLNERLVSVFPEYLHEIITIHTGTQIYKSPKDSEGPHYYQYRDCIDWCAMSIKEVICRQNI
jgi:hypothetical protein